MKTEKKENVDFEKLVDFINSVIPKSKKETDIIISFENIWANRKNKSISLHDLRDFMKKNKHEDFNKFDAFFKLYCKVIRKQINNSEFLKNNLLKINENQFIDQSKILNPKLRQEARHDNFSYDLAFEAYNHLLDEYDANKTESWNGFWSLIATKQGKLAGVFLFDTADREIFWDFIRKNQKKV